MVRDALLPRGQLSLDYSSPSMLNSLNLLGLDIAKNVITELRVLVLLYIIYIGLSESHILSL